MAERIEVDQRLQLGVQSDPLVPVATTKIMQTLKATPHIMTVTEEFVGSGFKFPNFVGLNEEWTELDLTGPIDFNESLYMLASLLNNDPAPATIVGGKRWTFRPSYNSPDDPMFFTIELGDPNEAERLMNAIMIDGTWTFNRRSPQFKGKMIGTLMDFAAPLTVGPAANAVQTITIGGAPAGGTFAITYNGLTINVAYNIATTALQTALEGMANIGTGNVIVSGTAGTSYVLTFGGALTHTFINPMTVDGSLLTGGTSPTATIAQTALGSGAAPTQLPIQPILGSYLDVFLDTSYGALGTTYLERDFSLEMALTGRFGPIWPMRTANPSYATTVELVPKSSVKLIMEADTEGKTTLGYLRAGSVFYVRLQASGPTLGTGTKYRLRMDMPLRVRAPGAFNDQEGVRALEYDCVLIADPTAGYPISVELQNAVTTP
jgi:hypothetical protein